MMMMMMMTIVRIHHVKFLFFTKFKQPKAIFTSISERYRFTKEQMVYRENYRSDGLVRSANVRIPTTLHRSITKLVLLVESNEQ